MNSASAHANGDERERKRSRSPYRDHGRDQVKRHRSRSPPRTHKHHHHRHSRAQNPVEQTNLPFRRNALEKADYDKHKSLFAYYLDVQKRLDLIELTEEEARGRWKSFMRKWNRGELAEGWYDPTMQEKAEERYGKDGKGAAEEGPKYERRINIAARDDGKDDEDDDFGPAPPTKSTCKAGPSIPTLGDIKHRQELAEEDRSAHMTDLRHSRKQDRTLQKERLEELAPRSDPGSKERQMEKKRDAAAVNREFRDAKEAGDVEVGEGELLGGDDGVEGYKAQLKAKQKIKNEREIRKEEVLRARAAEREEKMREVRAKEDKTMEMLKSIARQRFG